MIAKISEPTEYIALYDRNKGEDFESFHSKQEALDFLNLVYESNQAMPIAIIFEGKAVWLNPYIKESMSLSRVTLFLTKISKK